MSSMQSASDEPAPEFREELSQLIHHHIESGASPEDIVDALEVQSERVRAHTGGPDQPTSNESDEYRW